MTQTLIRPPEESWLRGRLLGPVVLYGSDSPHAVFADADVYPVGILMHLIARFRDLPTREAQLEVRRQVSAFHQAPATSAAPHRWSTCWTGRRAARQLWPDDDDKPDHGIYIATI